MKKKIINMGILFVTIIFTSALTAYATGNYFYSGTDIGYDNSQSGIASDNVQGAIDDLREKATNYNEIRAMIYPVGSIYMSITDDTVSKVQERFGGTWEKIEGKFLLSSSSSYEVNTTGGSADAVVVSHTHPLSGTAASAGGHSHTISGTAASAGSHSHTISAGINEASSGLFTSITGTRSYKNTHIINGSGSTNNTGAHTHSVSGSTNNTGAHTHSVSGTATSVGESGTGKNMPPYYVVNVYKRVS